MAQRLTERQDEFCRKFVELGNASAAYRAVYNAKNMKDKTIHEKASRLMASDKVGARVQELKQAHQERHEVTVDDLVKELDEARIAALANPRGTSAAVSAIMGKAKLLGLIVDKNEHSGKDGAPLMQPVINVSAA